MAYVKQLKDADTGDAIFPVTHIDAVTNGSGSNVGNLLNAKQDNLVSGTNIKTINDNSLLGSGNVYISDADIDYTGDGLYALADANTVQEALDLLDTAVLGQTITYRRLTVTNNSMVTVTLYPNNVYQLCSNALGAWAAIRGINISFNYGDCGEMTFTTAAVHKSSFPIFRCIFKTDTRTIDPFMTLPRDYYFVDNTTPTFDINCFYEVTIQNHIVEVRKVKP